MSYTKQTWANGDIITAAKLNHMEDGIAGVEADVSSLDTQLLASMPHDTASGAIASFPDGAAMPVRDLSVAIEPVQAGSGDPSPDNVRPISGWTECKVTRTGKNLINQQDAITGTYTNSYYKECTVNGGEISAAHLLAGVTYTLSFDVVSSVEPFSISVGAGTGNYARDILSGSGDVRNLYSGRVSVTFTPTSVQLTSGDIIAFRAPRYDTTTNFTFTVSNIQLEIGSTATAYEAYQSQTYTIDLDGTRYGGTLDVTTGKLTVDMAIVDLGSFGWSKSSGTYGGFYATNAFNYRWSSDTKMLCSRYKFDGVRVSASYFGDNGTLTCYFGNVQPVYEIYIKDESLADKTASEFKTEMSGVQLVYELVTPIEVDLDPVTIETLLGTNNIFADCGDTTVDYYADTTLFVNKKIAAAVAALS